MLGVRRHMKTNISELIATARKLVGGFTLSRPDMDAGTVGCAILTKKGNIYTGICVSVSCGIGFCAEHAAVAEMLKSRETEIDMIVAVAEDCVLAPCGRCRELLVQINSNNLHCAVVLAENESVKLRELLPKHWLDRSDA
jgi:cytidine deaminase